MTVLRQDRSTDPSGRPFRRTSPDVGVSSPRVIFASVDFPQPLSPTTPRVWPAARLNEMPSTARSRPRREANMLRPNGKCLTTSRTSNTGASPDAVTGSDTGDQLLGDQAGREVSPRHLDSGWNPGQAGRHRMRAPGSKCAAVPHVTGIRWSTRDDVESGLPMGQLGHRLEQGT